MLEKCIQMDPKFIPGYIELFKLKRGKPAEELLREMAAIATKDQSILFMFGKWLMMHGECGQRASMVCLSDGYILLVARLSREGI